MIQKAVDEIMIDLDIKELMSAIKMIDLNAEVSAEKILVVLVFEIDDNSIHIEMALIDQNTIVLLQTIMVRSEIWYLETLIFLLVCCLINIVITDEYS